MSDRNYDKEYPQMLKFILAREGGYSNNKDDLGGETNKGITHTTYNSYRRSKGLPTQSVKYISEDEMQEIYYNNYYKASEKYRGLSIEKMTEEEVDELLEELI